MKIVNLTPHPLTLCGAGLDFTIPPSGIVARVASTPGKVYAVEGVPVPVVGAPSFGAVEGLPPPEEGVVYIVSGLVAAHVARPDVFSPGTGPTDAPRRNAEGQIIGVTRLVCSDRAPEIRGT